MDYIFTHIEDCLTLLNKRTITKEILFKYLHSKNVSVKGEFTKVLLIKKVMNYWSSLKDTEEPYQPPQILLHEQQNGLAAEDASIELSTTTQMISRIPSKCLKLDSATSTINVSPSADESEFPIHLLARKFSEWFFNNYNGNTLKSRDFWSDSRLLLRIAANDGFDEHVCDDSNSLLDTLYDIRQKFGFFFNPNLTHAGVQGRMDVHGLVVVLACGTLHTENDCVGLFECAFGLLRDPFSENNWKTKTIQLMLRSKGAPATPSLEDSDTLREALTLPVPQGELT